VAHNARGIADNQLVEANVFGYDGSSAYQGEAADRHAGENDGPSPNRGPLADGYALADPIVGSLESTVWCHCARVRIVQQAGVRADEDATLKAGPTEHGRIVLDLAAVTDDHCYVDIDTLTDDTVTPDTRSFAHLRPMPNSCSFSNGRLRRNFGGGMDHGR